MTSEGRFKVVIAGGGIAGLTLANMLETFDLEYILLEAHDNIAPAAGASIGMLPNGLRIMDQIGCYDSIMELPHQPANYSSTRNSKGEMIRRITGFYDKMMKRHGYPILFFDRQWLLKVLYNHLKHKDRVILKKKVVKIIHTADCVTVATQDGDTFSGTFIVGADGIHSSVRGEMIRIANEIQPGYFDPTEPSRVPCYYRCSFGIAQNVPNYTTGETNHVMGKDYSGFLVSGPENRVYWFVFQRLSKPEFGDKIPKYTKEDEAKFVQENWDLRITEKVTFGQIYSKKLASALTPLHEVVFSKWFFQRIITLGDSAHKPNPISGQGGNCAIESMAELVNAILDTKHDRPNGLDHLMQPEVQKIFERVQSVRYERAKMLVSNAHKQQALSARENPLSSAFVWQVVAPFAGEDFFLNPISGQVMGAPRLNRLPLPERARSTPFDDELPRKTLGEGSSNFVTVIFVGGMASLIWVAYRTWKFPFFI